MRTVGKAIGKSGSYIAHLETGRMDMPEKFILNQILDQYGIRMKYFKELVRNYQETVSSKQELLELVDRMNDKNLETLLAVAKGLVG